MLPGPGPCSIEELLAQSSWLRRLAASLVAGDEAAEDLVQETWLAALRHPPRDAGSPRPWLARIARNLASNFRRGEARRTEREARAPERGPESDPGAVVEEVEAQRALAEAVLRLEEPLRTAVVLRYLRGLDSRAIGRLQGVPAGTVRWRLKRGLECLRADLDRRFGERGAWCVAFAGLARHGAGAGPTGSTLAGTATKLGATATLATAGVLLLCGGWWITGGSEPRSVASAGTRATTEIARATEAEDAELASPGRVDESTRTSWNALVETDPAPSATERPARSRRGAPIRGQLHIANTKDLLDESLTIRLRAGDMSVKETVQSAPDGSFRSKRPFPRGFVLGDVLRPTGDSAGDCEAFFDPGSDQEWVLPVPWPNFVRCRLVDGAGRHLTDFEITLLQGGVEGKLDRGSLNAGGFSYTYTGLDLGPCTVIVQRGFERHEFSTTVTRGPNELGEVIVPFRERIGPVRGRLRSEQGKPFGLLVLTDLASGVSYHQAATQRGEGVSEFEFEVVPVGDYHLTLLAYDGFRYMDPTRFVRPPATEIEFVATGEMKPLSFRALDGVNELPTEGRVLVSGCWCDLEISCEPADVERWFLASKGHRPASGRGLETPRVDAKLEPGWGYALIFTETSGGDYPEEKGPVAGVEVRADGVMVARSDLSGLALVSLSSAPSSLDWGLDGWVVMDDSGIDVPLSLQLRTRAAGLLERFGSSAVRFVKLMRE